MLVAVAIEITFVFYIPLTTDTQQPNVEKLYIIQKL